MAREDGSPETYRREPCPHCPPVWWATRIASRACTGGAGRIVRARSEKSYVSQEHANQLALEAARAAVLAETVCDPLVTYTSTRTGTAECPEGQFGGPSTAEVTYVSEISQEDADFNAQSQADELAAANLVCYFTPIFGSTQEYTAECADGLFGDPVTRTGFGQSTESQEAADALALAAAQAAAEAALDCQVGFIGEAHWTAACPYGTTGGHVTSLGTAFSTISQEDADAAALTAAIANSNAALLCTPLPSFTGTAVATASCPGGTTGDSVTVTRTVLSYVSQDDADDNALALATADANQALVCQPIVFTATSTQTASCPEGYDGAPQTVTASGTSTVSQADAQAIADAAALAAAQDHLVCVLHLFISTQSFTAECPEGFTGSSTQSGYGESYTSQDDADAIALAAAQEGAEATLVCTPDAGPPVTFDSTDVTFDSTSHTFDET